MANSIEIKPKYLIGDTVYLHTDEDQREYLVLAIIVCPSAIRYRIGHGANGEIECADFEIRKEKRVF